MMQRGAAFAVAASYLSRPSGEAVAAGRLLAGLPQKLSGEEAIRRFLAVRAAELEREFLPGITTAADFEEVRPALRDDLFDMLGLKPMPERTPLKAKITGRSNDQASQSRSFIFRASPDFTSQPISIFLDRRQSATRRFCTSAAITTAIGVKAPKPLPTAKVMAYGSQRTAMSRWSWTRSN
jgi:hypothetical protein